MITAEQLQAIATLRFHPGFVHLLDSMQADLDDETDKLAETPVTQDALYALARWQAHRQVLATLRDRPAHIAAAFTAEETDDTLPNGEPIAPLPQPSPNLFEMLQSTSPDIIK